MAGWHQLQIIGHHCFPSLIQFEAEGSDCRNNKHRRIHPVVFSICCGGRFQRGGIQFPSSSRGTIFVLVTAFHSKPFFMKLFLAQ